MIHRATFVTVTAGRARAARNARLLKRLFRARAAPTTAASGFLANAISETDASPSREIAKGIRDAADLLGARRGACGSTPRRARDAARRRVCLQTFFSDVQERFERGRAIRPRGPRAARVRRMRRRERTRRQLLRGAPHAGVAGHQEIRERQRALERGSHALLLGDAGRPDHRAHLGRACGIGVARAHALLERTGEREP